MAPCMHAYRTDNDFFNGSVLLPLVQEATDRSSDALNRQETVSVPFLINLALRCEGICFALACRRLDYHRDPGPAEHETL
jgi:hypothetical protein